MSTHANPYQVFIDVLAHRYAGERRLALTGDLIAAYAEMNHLLARTKGKLEISVWVECASELERCLSMYRVAWLRFSAEVENSVSGEMEAASHPSLGPETTQTFQQALNGVRATLGVMRRESSLIGYESWVR